MDGAELPGLVALDEPTRGMDRARKDDLVRLVDGLATQGAGVVVATHDVEFAAAFAERVVLLGDGVVIADGAAADVLSGGWYFATEVARVLDLPGVVTPEQGAAVLRAAGEGPR
jgi:energy-coupling factor transport system ATP-binding protein